ncbi:dihydropyrimidinase [Panicum miliaceum]|uniref:dihydropyrimidinase n=1 Tax=Panicum miliaceum TaxID=4540 RepID=A0A3L6QYF9_PANMI|nr:dihydropyrimidinase [Panicum miliaceum]
MTTPSRRLLLLLPLLAVAVAASHPAHEVGVLRWQFCAAEGDAGCGGGGDGARILIKGGTVVNAHRAEEADVYIEDGVVVAIRPNIPVGDDNVRVIDATGNYVMPGGIDPHTHLAMEFMGTVTIDDFFSGHAAALAGGTMMHIDFVIPVNGNLTAGLESYKQKAANAAMDYGFHMAITKWNDEVAREMEVMVKEHGINYFKFFMAYKGSLMVTDDLLLQGLQKCKSLGALAMVHAENGDAVAEGQQRMIDLGITGPEGHALSRPPILEGEATAWAIRLAKFINTPLYVVHVMSVDAMEEIAKREGQRIIGEPVVSGLVLDDSWLWNPDFTIASKYVMSPPIREAGHGDALVAYSKMWSQSPLKILVGTDHCTFNSTQKAFGSDDFRKIPNGVNGDRQDFCHHVRVTSTECAKIFNIYPRKGAILEGSDADIIILNPERSFVMGAHTHHSRSNTNVYEGRKGKASSSSHIKQQYLVWNSNPTSEYILFIWCREWWKSRYQGGEWYGRMVC